MNTNQKILLILATVFCIGFFMPYINQQNAVPGLFNEETKEAMSLSMSVFDMITNPGNYDLGLFTTFIGFIIFMFFTMLIAMPVLAVTIALTQKFEWLFTISVVFIIYSLSMIYSMNPGSSLNEIPSMKLGSAWALFFIPSLIMLVMGLIALLKKNQNTTA